jgi:hypothetical protein
MASSHSTITNLVIERHHTRYHWPALQLNFWILIMFVGSAVNLGIFAYFMAVQTQLNVGIPWYAASILFAIYSTKSTCRKLTRISRYFPYWVTVGALSITYICIMLWLISQRQLLPGIVIMGAFMLFVLWTVGLIVISVQLWGPSGSVNSNCQLYVDSMQSTGPSTDTLAWLEQRSICMFPLPSLLHSVPESLLT